MSIVWEQRIRSFDRPVKRRNLRLLRAGDRQAAWRAAKGLPSRSLPSELFFETLRLKLMSSNSTVSADELKLRRWRLEYEILRTRLLERKRHQRALIRRREVKADRTCINLWRRRRDWLAHVEANGEAD
jgi:hypothetical protein